MKKSLSSILIVVLCLRLAGQSPLLQHYTVAEGLANSSVYDAWQDEQGFIWLGTEAGLSRFDGANFKTFTTADGLPANCVIKVEGDAEGRMWLGCFKKKTIRTEKDGLPFSKINSLERDPGGCILAGDARGSLVFLKNGRPGKSLRIGRIFNNRLLTLRYIEAAGSLGIGF